MGRAGLTTALTTTVKLLDATFSLWCAHHLRFFDYIFVWIDDSPEVEAPFIPIDDRVIVQLGCQERDQSILGTSMHRQDRNTNRALGLCEDLGVTWLCHLDSDEILCPKNGTSLPSMWESEMGHITLPNHEVCPLWKSANPFQDCHYFKLNGKCEFNFYDNGKSAVRCGPGVTARGAHAFRGYVGQRGLSKSVSILHYTCATFDWWVLKYQRLGTFPDFFWDNPAYPIPFLFHLRSRDVYRQCMEEADLSKAYELFGRQVLDETRLQQLVSEGKVGRFTPLEDHWS